MSAVIRTNGVDQSGGVRYALDFMLQ